MEVFLTLPQDGRRQTIHLAASLCSLDCDVRTDLIHDYKTQKSNRTFSISGSPRTMLRHLGASGEVAEKHILTLWRNDQAPTDHPFMDCIRACLNYEFIKAAQRGICGSLRLAQDGPHRTRYILGDELPSLKLTPRAKCADPRKIAALGILGVPIQKMEGEVATLGMGIHLPQLSTLNSQPFHDPAEILRQFNDETLPRDHPFLIAWAACASLDLMDEHLEKEPGKVCYSVAPLPGERRPHKAYFTPNAPGIVMDRARRWTDTGR